MLIRSMGLFWKREDVFWGEPGARREGKLLGLLPGARKKGPVDFWDQVGLYALYGDYRLVYVGQTAGQRLGVRLRHHRRDHLAGRWDGFSWFGLCSVKKDGTLARLPQRQAVARKEALDLIEAILIGTAEPALNTQSGRFGKVPSYVQCRDDRLPQPPDKQLKDIEARLKVIEARLP